MLNTFLFSFRNKILLIILFIGVVPISVTGILSNMKFNSLLENQAHEITLKALQQSEGYLSMYLSEIEQLGIFATTNDQILHILQKQNDASSYEKVTDASLVTNVMKPYLRTRSDIERLDILGFNGFSYTGGYSNKSLDANEPWAKEAAERGGMPYWYAIEDGEFMVYSRLITGNKANETLGFIRIVIPSYRLESVLNRFQPMDTGVLLLIDRNQNPIIGRSQDVKELAQTLAFGNSAASNRYATFNGSKLFVTQYVLDKTDWLFVSAVPREDILQGTAQIRGYFFNTVLIILLITITIAIWTTQRFTRPFKQFIRMMRDVERNNFKSRMDITAKDEIGQLAISYNRMAQRVDSLINEVYEQQILKNEAEWNALQAQINPHFLYNTLDSINWIARSHRITDIVKMVTALSKLFKLSLAKKDKLIAVEEELQYIRYYAQIQETRFSDRISIHIDVPELLMAYKIPRFILQPLVENSIVHGLERKEGPGRVDIKGAEYGDKIFFIIQDNGVGIPAAKLQTLLERNVRNDKHLGLSNVDERIKLLYGEEWGLKLDSIEGEGTIVEVWLRKDIWQADLQREEPEA
ncbi:two-component sensor histidine kinase [Paenibacillus agaridevorans]|uniref:Two-component sensor histidine kinase n=1 Tax=Paenibacillus agaridevorans TaxID=171404 RepID=A0A2R5EVI3_9BACL|nr:histidine kinase [Paenibacillus agaridevorans]GBG10567.1 two-component sensor histidine kinase [Paenibacillus agaridevorans]